MNFRNFIYNGQQPGPAHSLPAQQLENQVACGPNSLCLPHNLCSTTTHHPLRTTHQLMGVRSCRIAFTFTPSPSPSRSRASNWN